MTHDEMDAAIYAANQQRFGEKTMLKPTPLDYIAFIAGMRAAAALCEVEIERDGGDWRWRGEMMGRECAESIRYTANRLAGICAVEGCGRPIWCAGCIYCGIHVEIATPG